MEDERSVAAKKFFRVERRAEREMSRFRELSLAELRQIDSDSATQSVWLRNRKLRPQVVGVDR